MIASLTRAGAVRSVGEGRRGSRREGGREGGRRERERVCVCVREREREREKERERDRYLIVWNPVIVCFTQLVVYEMGVS